MYFFQMKIEKIELQSNFPATLLAIRIFAKAYENGSNFQITEIAKENIFFSFRREFRKLNMNENEKIEKFNLLMGEKRPWDKFNGKTLEEFLENSLQKDIGFVIETWMIQNEN